MQAIVLVGGYGTRLRPLTLDRPKPLLPIVHRSMLERSVAGLGRVGVDEVVLALGFRPDAFRESFPDDEIAGVKLRYAVEPEPLDTAGAVGFAADVAGIDSRCLVLNGDVLTDLDVSKLLDLHDRSGAAATIHLTEVDDPSRFGVVPIDQDGRVEAFVEKPPAESAPSTWINAGTYVIEPELLGMIPVGERCSIEREIFPRLVERREMFALQDSAYWIDCGTPESYLQASMDLIDGSRASEAGVRPDAEVAAGATVERSVIGSGARVEAGAHVADAVVLAGATVGAGARVTHSVLGEAAKVGESAVVEQVSIVGHGEVVSPGQHLEGARLPES